MKIDLRYIIPIIAFYVPGLLMLIGAWALGYSTADVRVSVSRAGAILGFFSAGMAFAACLTGDIPPIWLRRRGKDE